MSNWVHHLQVGVVSGVLPGILLTMILGPIGMFTTIGRTAGRSNPIIGFSLHLFSSAMMGAAFAVVFGQRLYHGWDAWFLGLGYSLVWWLFFGFTLTPRLLDGKWFSRWSRAGFVAAFPGLLGHLLFGLLMAATYVALSSEVKP